MTPWWAHPLRVSWRLLLLGTALFYGAIVYAKRRAVDSRDSQPFARARWLQELAGRVLRILRVETRYHGEAPVRGLLVCNHLGYLDILVLAAARPSIFVAKSEVKQWPVFGWFARLAGTIFVHRGKPLQAAQSADQIALALRDGALVVLFPEGTSSGGETVLPFKSSLLEPATRHGHPMTVGLIAYHLADGCVSEEVCYWKDMTLLPHLLNLLSKRSIRASVQFAERRPGNANRKELARELHAEVLRLKAAVQG